MITHEKIDVGFNIVEDLWRNSLINVCTYTVLKLAERHGGFIAGGFAAAYATNYYAQQDKQKDAKDVLSIWSDSEDDKYKLMRGYYGLGKGIKTLENVRKHKDKSPFANSFKHLVSSDIDVWFKDKSGLERFFVELKTGPQIASQYGIDVKIGNILAEPTPLKYGTQFLCLDAQDRSADLVQALTRHVGSIAEITDSFDIYNAACAIDGNTLYVPEGFQELLKRGQIHIHNFKTNTPYVLFSRIKKWRSKQFFKSGFTEETKAGFVDLVDDLVKQSLSEKGVLGFAGSRLTTNETLLMLFKQMIKFLNEETLLKLSAYFASGRARKKDCEDQYDFFFKELLTRGCNNIDSKPQRKYASYSVDD